MKGLSTKFHITVGLGFLLLSLMLSAVFFGLVPDQVKAMRDGRANLLEATASSSSLFIEQGDVKGLEANLDFLVSRNDEIESAAVRRANGTTLLTVGEHEAFWGKAGEAYSTDTDLQVPIWAGTEKWGRVELRYKPLTAPGLRGFFQNANVRLIAFIVFAGFIGFYLYLSKMLKQLDPSQAVPARVRSALDTIVEGLLVVDNKRRIVLSNIAFASLMSKSSDDLLGVNVSDLPWYTTDGEAAKEEDYPWIKALQEKNVTSNDMICLQDANSKRRTFIVNCSPVLSSGGKQGGVLISFDDVTLLEEKEVELRLSKAEAEEANQAKSEFLANMSHEIRSPMNAILGFTEVLKRGYFKDKDDWLKHLNTISSSGNHLLELINDVLDLSKVEAGRLDIEQIECVPHIIIQDVIQVLAVKANEKGISLDMEVSGPIPESIVSDSARLRQIVTNLLTNAIKFTEKGGIRVVMRLIPSRSKPLLAIDVIDNGIGIAEAQLETIFEEFTQADTSITRRFGGTGLGLSISRRLSRLLGGDITVSSEAGKGSVFTATVATGSLENIRLLTQQDIAELEQVTQSGDAIAWEFPPARVLVVDDGQENRDLATLVLEQVGLTVEQAENGKLGADRALQETFDVILMDIQMPVMDGNAATRYLRKQGLKTPIVALTAHAMKGFEEEIEAAGFTGFMTKPIDIDGLIEMLAHMLGGKRVAGGTGGDFPAMPVASVPVADTPAEVDAPLVSRLPAGNPRFRDIIRKFVVRLDEQLQSMEQAWQARNFEELANLAHWLKGSGGTVGFDAFTAPAASLEQLARAGQEEQVAETLLELSRLARRIALPEEDKPASMGQSA
ncbi:MAG: ATP-binding protein [Gammaproteobacteria bacterium]